MLLSLSVLPFTCRVISFHPPIASDIVFTYSYIVPLRVAYRGITALLFLLDSPNLLYNIYNAI